MAPRLRRSGRWAAGHSSESFREGSGDPAACRYKSPAVWGGRGARFGARLGCSVAGITRLRVLAALWLAPGVDPKRCFGPVTMSPCGLEIATILFQRFAVRYFACGVPCVLFVWGVCRLPSLKLLDWSPSPFAALPELRGVQLLSASMLLQKPIQSRGWTCAVLVRLFLVSRKCVLRAMHSAISVSC